MTRQYNTIFYNTVDICYKPNSRKILYGGIVKVKVRDPCTTVT